METTEIISEPRRLTRPKEERWLGGVAAGLGEYFDLSPAIYRIAFVALALAGGTGILLYLAAWLVIPEEGDEDSIAADGAREAPRPAAAPRSASRSSRSSRSSFSRSRTSGRARERLARRSCSGSRRWSGGGSGPRRPRGGASSPPFAIGLVALLLATVAFAVRVPLFAGVGARVDRPVDVADVHSKYELGIGNLTLDFANVSLPKGQTFVKATVGIGELKVIVPANASVEVEGRVQAGQLRLLDERDSGTHVRAHVVDRTGSGRVLVLDARAGLGKVRGATRLNSFANLRLPRVQRAGDKRVVAGVCSGIGQALDVDATLVRLTFAFLALASGAGIVAYAGAWALLPSPGDERPGTRRRVTGVLLLVWAGILTLGGLGLSDSLVWPLALVAAGVVLLSGSTFGLAERRARLVAVALIVAGIVIFVGNNTRGTASTLLAPGAVGVALLLVLGPWAWRLARSASAQTSRHACTTPSSRR